MPLLKTWYSGGGAGFFSSKPLIIPTSSPMFWTEKCEFVRIAS